ncbi:PQQ-dependent sugar dehydrogenase [Panacibacter sp. DH6]|uniref:PQQ-dependent sugar dehydrogenase n=1 Tax=Panacibacter microcysteis TaxID=2793269 RepID=A0A931GZD7_9BACT|nr:PQQ-dependent sugar dehydrogenase [Panacibacter microcysteis]MBG9378145.1 PQQ-dependent sugar dehydrogenase [Panacibacter microcysteis]
MKITFFKKQNLLFCIVMLYSFFLNNLSAQPELTFTSVAAGLELPLNMKSANDSTGRLFIVEQTGKIKILKDGQVQPKPFLDIANLVAVGEYKGLWSVAFPPDFKRTRAFFVYYYDKANNTILARYQVSKTNPDSVILNSRVEVLSLKDTVTTFSHLGEMQFGRDGNLYLTVSDGSFLNRTVRAAQDSTTLFGKMLRINVRNGITAPYYTIPPDNPFAGSTTVKREIFMMGLRNAWRWSFDKQTMNIWIADDGGEQWDEINFVPRNQVGFKNFGWPCYEGSVTFVQQGCADSAGYTFPVFENPPDSNGEQAIIGGFVYRGKNYPMLRGYYICSDYIQNKAWKIRTAAGGTFNIFEQLNIPPAITSYAEDEAGELYATSAEGIIYRVGAALPVAKE